ncbi:MAG: M28 family peptidase [Planctomycetes bacterium]|nr:M28 family peptidase [Planctomycetota bacterium]MCB9918949.1 M28 family peptidase [Planctomycetota bacterium]
MNAPSLFSTFPRGIARIVLATMVVVPSVAQGQVEAPPKPDGSKPTLASIGPMPTARATITAADLKTHAMTLASDEYEGRLTGTAGQLKAAEYFRKHFESLGLEPWGDTVGGKRGYEQTYEVRATGLVPEQTGIFDAAGKRICEYGAWFVNTRKKQEVKVQGRLVWCGSTNPREMALQGAIAVCVMPESDREPRSTMAAFGEGFRLMAEVRAIAKNADAGGARGCILVSKELSVSFLSAANMSTSYPGKPQIARGRGRPMFGDQVPKVPTVAVDGKDAAALLKVLGIDGLSDWSDEQLVGKKSKAQVRIKAKPYSEDLDAKNIVAVLEGRDPKLKNELVVFSCHMDHLGLTANGGVFNGADDNASGSSTVLEIAEAFSKLEGDARPRRSIMFLAVSGEELGLWGSEHFASHPTWPIDKIVADINMDMLGRSTDKVPSDSVALTPTFRNKDYSTLARRAAELGASFDLKMTNGDKFYQRSDHWNFAKEGIPVVFFCDDEHADYHMPSDTPEKLEYDKIERIARLAFTIGYEVANDDARPKQIGKQEDWFSEGH